MKILIIHTFGLGDMIMFTPTLKLLQEYYPDAEIDIVIFQKAAAQPIEYCPEISNVFYTGFAPKQILQTIAMLRRQHYDFTISTSGTAPFKIAFFAYLIGATERIGEYRKIKSPFYTRQVKYQEKLHRVVNNMMLMDENNRATDFAPYFCLPVECNIELPAAKLIDKVKIAIHAGSNLKFKYKRWAVKYFIKLLQYLSSNYNCDLLIIAGPDELVESKMIADAVDATLVADTTIAETAKIISQCDVMINSDSGLGHIAACFDVEIFTIFGPAKAYKASPYSSKAHIIKKNLPCQPCYGTKRLKKCRHFNCLNKLMPEDVFNEIKNNSKELEKWRIN
jgi:ADP-heptose:LPS heptosyltransferase